MKKHDIRKKLKWLERAIETYNYHVTKINNNPGWTLEDSSNALGRSTGSISEDIMIASWTRTHESQIKNCKYAYQAIEFIRNKKMQLNSETIDS